jgi:amino acid transporter
MTESDNSDETVTPDAEVPGLDEESLVALRDVGRHWTFRGTSEDPQLPVDPELGYAPDGAAQAGRFVEIRSTRSRTEDELEATPEAGFRDSALGRAEFAARRLLIGPPLRSSAVAEERMGRLMALSVLAPDALSSVAYGPEAMLAILVLAGSSELKLSLPIAAVLVVLMISVGLGYRQVIRAYPHGGGSYIVASKNLGPRWGLVAGAGLIVDYTLTVAVSVAAGVAAVMSAFPEAASATVPIGLGVIAALVLANLRGVTSSGWLFAVPSYMFVAAIALIVTIGLIKSASHGFQPMAPVPKPATQAVGLLLILRAFSSGATAMTGIEVVSNAVSEFKPPQAENARRTLSVMITMLVLMFIGVIVVAHLDGATPGEQTVLSQIAHRSVGTGLLYGYVQLATTLVLLIAANSAVNGFPRLLYVMARDGYAPRGFLHMGDRLAFSVGIAVLAVPAAALYVGFGGKTEPLIPLFAVGVFVAFTLAQSAMVVFWRRHRTGQWRRRLTINLVGALLSAVVTVVAAITKFTSGAWVVVLLIPLIVLCCLRVNRHYELARDALRPRPEGNPSDMRARSTAGDIAEGQESPSEIAHLLVVPVAVLDLAALRALAYAASLDLPILAVHIAVSREEDARFRDAWRAWGDHVRLEVVTSPYRATAAPLANYIAALHRERPDVTVTVVVPELITKRRWQRLLHHRTAQRLSKMLIHYDGIAVTSVPFHLSR